MIKRFILALALLPSLCMAAGGDLLIIQRLPDDSSEIRRLMVKPANNADGVMGFNGATQRPSFLQLGQGLSLSGGVLTASAAAQVNADWSATNGAALILNKPALFSGAYGDLSGKPAIPPAQVQSDWSAPSGVAQILNKPSLFSGSYADLSGRPSLSAVATSGAYGDLTGLPSIPAAQQPSDWAASSGVTRILNKPALFSGSYGDLSGRPSLAAVATSGSYADLTSRPALATVATSGAYLDLSGRPAIPAAQVQSDWNSVSAPSAILNKPILFSGAYSALTGIPSTFAPAAHTQPWSTITSTPTTLSGYGITDAASSSQLAAKFNTPSGTTAQYVRGDGSLATLPAAKRIETYTGTTNAAGQVVVTYSTVFSQAPNVQPPPPALANQVWTLVSSTAAGFTLQLNQRNTVTLLSTEVLLGATAPVVGSAAQVLVIER